jgi:hypothetical protein
LRDVWIAIPAYTGQIHLGTMRSVISDLLVLAERGDKVTIFDESGNAMIADCRGLIVAKFLESEGTDLVFVDSDVAWEAGALVKLVDHPVDFVAGVYPQRRDPIAFCVQYLNDRPNLIADPDTGLLEVMGVPAGFMRMRRGMLERMVEHYSDTAFFCEAAPNQTAHALFDPVRIGRMKFGEDYSFCKRWRDIGGQVWVDPEMTLVHVGYKSFVGSLGTWLKERPDA